MSVLDGARRRLLRSGAARRTISKLFLEQLVDHTRNFDDVTWLGRPVWQNVLDLWTVQETLCALRPELVIECGTHRGGSAFFYATLFDLLDHGRVVTIDVERRSTITHPRVEFITGDSVSAPVVARVREIAASVRGPVFVILDSDHAAGHVRREAEAYAPFVTEGSFMLVQDGVIDELPGLRAARPGPVPAIRDFLRAHPEFEIDRARCERFLVTHHPLGWLRRITPAGKF